MTGWIMLTTTDGEGRKVMQAFNIAARPPVRVCPTMIGPLPGCIVNFSGGIEYYCFQSFDEVMQLIREAQV